MEEFLHQVEAASKARLFYLELFAALSLPDICGALGSADGKSTRPRYIAWFDEYVAPSYVAAGVPSFSGEDAYYFRCSFIHQGSSQHPKSTYSCILFVEPGATTNVFHNNVMMGALNIDVDRFCRDVISGVRVWHAKARESEPFETNYDRMMKRFPNGLAPYIVGVPVIS